MEKIDNIQEQMGNVRKNLEILRKNKDRNFRDQKHYIRNEEYL